MCSVYIEYFFVQSHYLHIIPIFRQIEYNSEIQIKCIVCRTQYKKRFVRFVYICLNTHNFYFSAHTGKVLVKYCYLVEKSESCFDISSCNIVSLFFIFKDSASFHMIKFMYSSEMKCNICQKNIKSKNANLQRHIKLHEPHERYKCLKCTQTCGTKYN